MISVSRDAMERAVIYLAADLSNGGPWWLGWDEEQDGPDPDRKAILEVIAAIRQALEDGEQLVMPDGKAVRVHLPDLG